MYLPLALPPSVIRRYRLTLRFHADVLGEGVQVESRETIHTLLPDGPGCHQLA